MSTKNLVIAAVILIVVLGGVLMLGKKSQNSYQANPNANNSLPSSAPTASKSGASIVLDEQNSSGESGLATITQENGKVVVNVKLTGAPDDVEQPAHLHLGTCTKPGEIKYPLNNVIKGESKTVLEVDMETFNQQLPLILNIHKSNDEISVYVACGTVSK